VSAGGSARSSWRLLVDPPHDAAWNMAVDEAILDAYETAATPLPPTLRLYGWSPAALSLGKTQRAEGAHDARALRDEGVDLVRRPTGGEAVLHEHERTYAVVGAGGSPPFGGGPVDTYRSLARALVAGLARLGIAAEAVEPAAKGRVRRGVICFERVGAWEIASSGRKLVGSSQFRRRRAFLQHGSLPLRLEARRLALLTGVPTDATRFTDLESAAGREVDPAELDAAVVAGIEEVFGATCVAGRLTPGEELRAAELRCWKYDSMAWTLTGAIGQRERRWGPAPAR
jgi:lipoyl(octanoyl) transferase